MMHRCGLLRRPAGGSTQASPQPIPMILAERPAAWAKMLAIAATSRESNAVDPQARTERDGHTGPSGRYGPDCHGSAPHSHPQYGPASRPGASRWRRRGRSPARRGTRASPRLLAHRRLGPRCTVPMDAAADALAVVEALAESAPSRGHPVDTGPAARRHRLADPRSWTCQRTASSAQAGRPGRRAGLLVMRRSGVRFPKAAQFKGLISLIRSPIVDRDSRSTNATCRLSAGRQAVT
jgi:hypothetical protein